MAHAVSLNFDIAVAVLEHMDFKTTRIFSLLSRDVYRVACHRLWNAVTLTLDPLSSFDSIINTREKMRILLENEHAAHCVRRLMVRIGLHAGQPPHFIDFVPSHGSFVNCLFTLLGSMSLLQRFDMVLVPSVAFPEWVAYEREIAQKLCRRQFGFRLDKLRTNIPLTYILPFVKAQTALTAYEDYSRVSSDEVSRDQNTSTMTDLDLPNLRTLYVRSYVDTLSYLSLQPRVDRIRLGSKATSRACFQPLPLEHLIAGSVRRLSIKLSYAQRGYMRAVGAPLCLESYPGLEELEISCSPRWNVRKWWTKLALDCVEDTTSLVRITFLRYPLLLVEDKVDDFQVFLKVALGVSMTSMEEAGIARHDVSFQKDIGTGDWRRQRS